MHLVISPPVRQVHRKCINYVRVQTASYLLLHQQVSALQAILTFADNTNSSMMTS